MAQIKRKSREEIVYLTLVAVDATFVPLTCDVGASQFDKHFIVILD
jgi:hypothetical protein